MKPVKTLSNATIRDLAKAHGGIEAARAAAGVSSEVLPWRRWKKAIEASPLRGRPPKRAREAKVFTPTPLYRAMRQLVARWRPTGRILPEVGTLIDELEVELTRERERQTTP